MKRKKMILKTFVFVWLLALSAVKVLLKFDKIVSNIREVNNNVLKCCYLSFELFIMKMFLCGFTGSKLITLLGIYSEKTRDLFDKVNSNGKPRVLFI